MSRRVSICNHGISRFPLLWAQDIVSGTKLVSTWVASHIGLASNSAAYAVAVAALLMPVSHLTVSYLDLYPLIRTHVLKQWHLTQNKLHASEPTVSIAPSMNWINFCDLLMGGYLLLTESPPPMQSVCSSAHSYTRATLYCATSVWCQKPFRIVTRSYSTVHHWSYKRNWILL